MPFDATDFPGASPRAARPDSRRLVAGWLLAVNGMLLVMVALGGATRLTGSGLSIMEWAPLSGALPPWSEAEWQRLFALYQQTPQYALLHDGFGLDGFKSIFWLEWVHRLWGRLIGIAFLLPLVWLWLTGRIERRLVPRLVLIFAVGGLQGAIGWFMVASGFFPDSISVAAWRLVLHLSLALLLYATVFWTALSVIAPAGRAMSGPRLRLGLRVLMGMLALTIIAGGFVAGTHAGFIHNTFPLMDGELIPSDYGALEPVWRNFTENVSAVQFDHRILATFTAALGVGVCAAGLYLPGGRPARPAFLTMGALICVQYGLGVATLIWVVPVGLATAHQVCAVLLLTACLSAMHAMRPVRAAAVRRRSASRLRARQRQG